MIFRRKRNAVDESELDESALPPEDPSGDPEEPATDEAERADGEPDLEALDARDWRSEGPFDITEVDDVEGTPELPRIDLGSMVLAGAPGAELRLHVSEETQQIVSAMLIHGESALELSAFAAPRSGGLWAELREEIVTSTVEAGGLVSLGEGPFGVELRRLIPATTAEGEPGEQPSRMWVAEGPRWLLRGIVYGRAAVDEDPGSSFAEMLTAFRQVIVRRGDEAMAPGDPLPLTIPQNLVADDAQAG